jgi:uncharacterized protein YigE (DUF2233 family)
LVRYKLIVFFFFSTLAVLPSSIGPAISLAADTFWQKIDEGFEARTMELNGPSYQAFTRLQILRIDPEKYPVRVMDSRAFGVDRMEIKEFVIKTKALAVMNGGFFLSDYLPRGLLIADYREVSPLRKVDWGIFLIRDNRPEIIHTREFQNDARISQALQAGPRLVVNGKELHLKNQLARRSALGITFKSQIIFLNTENTQAYFQDIAKVFRLSESEGGLDCRDALNLDGGLSSQMYGEYKNWKIDIPGGWPVPNGIGIFLKER